MFLRNPHAGEEEAVKVNIYQAQEAQVLHLALLTSGYKLLHTVNKNRYYVPCPRGTFSTVSAQAVGGCHPCPPGIEFKFP